MAHACCPDCRLRVVTAWSSDAPSCPGCRQPLVSTDAAASIGCRLVAPEPLPVPAEVAAAVALPIPRAPNP